jgi:putative redox protein
MSDQPERGHESRVAHVRSTSGEGYRTRIRGGRHEILADEPASIGGTDAGPSPFTLLLAGLAACTSITLTMYAERKGWDLGEIEVDLDLVRDGDDLRIARGIRIGAEIDADQRESLLRIAEKTPVTRAVRAGTPVATTIASA